jgi:hypothetical protein
MRIKVRIEKLEAHLPLSASGLLERLDRQSLNALCFHDRQLVSAMQCATSRRKAWSLEHRAAEASYLENFGVLLQEISDGDSASMISQIERDLGRPIPELEAIA